MAPPRRRRATRIRRRKVGRLALDSLRVCPPPPTGRSCQLSLHSGHSRPWLSESVMITRSGSLMRTRLLSTPICDLSTLSSPARDPSRVKALNERINAFVHFAEHTSLQEGRLSGLDVAVKDNICTRTMPTTCSSDMLKGVVPFHSISASLLTRLLPQILCHHSMPQWWRISHGLERTWSGKPTVTSSAWGASSSSALLLYCQRSC
jgi:hypothetical protein